MRSDLLNPIERDVWEPLSQRFVAVLNEMTVRDVETYVVTAAKVEVKRLVLWAVIERHVSETAKDYSTLGLSNIIQAFQSLGIAATRLTREVNARTGTGEGLDPTNIRESSAILRAFSRVELGDDSLFESYVSRCVKVVKEADLAATVSVFQSFARRRLAAPHLA